MSVVKTRSVSPSTPSHSVFALISLTGSKHNPVVLQKSKGSICQETSSPSPHGNRDGGASLLLEPHQKSTPGIWMECREVWGGSWILWGLVQLSQGFFSAHSLSWLQGRAARVSLSTNVSYLTAGSRKTPTVPGYSWGNMYWKAEGLG